MPRTLALTLIEYSGRTGLTVNLFAEADITNAIANGSGDTLTPGINGAFTATIGELLSGMHRAVVYDSTLAIAEGRAYFDGTNDAVIVDSAAQMLAAKLAGFKADAELGTASGGLVANAAQVLNVPRAAAAVTAGAPQAKHLENSLGATLQSVREVHDGDA